jgi:hypothetical protein
MPSFPTALNTGTPYVAQGVRKFYWLPSVANVAAVTRAEMTAGTDLTGNVTGLAGFDKKQNFVKRSTFGSADVGTIAGTRELSDSSMSFEQGANSVDVRSLLTEALVGYMLILNEGDVPGQKMDVFKAQVGSVAPQQQIGDNEAQIDIAFGLFSRTPNVTIPANP